MSEPQRGDGGMLLTASVAAGEAVLSNGEWLAILEKFACNFGFIYFPRKRLLPGWAQDVTCELEWRISPQ